MNVRLRKRLQLVKRGKMNYARGRKNGNALGRAVRVGGECVAGRLEFGVGVQVEDGVCVEGVCFVGGYER